MDFEAEGLLDGLADAKAREARLRLLRELHEEGFEPDELREAVADGRLALLPVERALAGESRFTAGDVVEQTGLTLEQIETHRQALGLPARAPDERQYSQADIDGLSRLKVLLDAGIDVDELIEVQRVLGAGMARYAEAIRSVIAQALLREGDNEYDVARRWEGSVHALLPLAREGLPHVFRMHLREVIHQDAIRAEELASGSLRGAEDVAIAFADLVGFTRLGEQLDSDELGSVANRLAALAGQQVRGPVRLVKTIGDAVMLVSREPVAMLEVVADLVDAADADEQLPELRAGVACGPAVNRYGDWYGSTVNIAARVCHRARPGSILVTEEIVGAAEQTGAPFRFSRAGIHRLRNVTHAVPLWRARRQEEEQADAAAA